jgi:hypothetical protein
MEVETFRHREAPTGALETTPVMSERRRAIESEVQRLTALGLHGQVRLVQEQCDGTEYDLPADMFYRRLPHEEVVVWCRFLGDRCPLETYSEDVIPPAILDEIEFAKRLDLFEDFVVRSPRKAHNDPIVLGLAKTYYGFRVVYMLGRWGESLQPFAAIQRQVRWYALRRFFSRLFG